MSSKSSLSMPLALRLELLEGMICVHVHRVHGGEYRPRSLAIISGQTKSLPDVVESRSHSAGVGQRKRYKLSHPLFTE